VSREEDNKGRESEIEKEARRLCSVRLFQGERAMALFLTAKRLTRKDWTQKGTW